jgi:hypothetical protein
LTSIIDFQKGLKIMTELIRIGQGFFEDLATVPEVEAQLLMDSCLTEREFATKHADTILDHYMSVFRFDFLQEDAEFFATAIWHYLQVCGLHNRNRVNAFQNHPVASWPGVASQAA